MSKVILIVDDEEGIRILVQGILEDEGYKTLVARNSQEALVHIESGQADLVIQDIWLEESEMDGLEILSHVKADRPHLPFIMISGHGTVETAVSSLKKGAYDFIEKPFKSDRLLIMIQRALENAQLLHENENLKNETRLKQAQVVETDIVEIPKEVASYSLDEVDLMQYPLKEAREIFEKKYLDMQINRFDGNISKTAEFIGMERSALHRKLKMLNERTSVSDESIQVDTDEGSGVKKQACS